VGERSIAKTLVKYCVEGLILTAILWLVSGRPDWIRAWIYVGFILGVQFAAFQFLSRVNPDLLVERSRLRKGTKGFDKVLAPAVAVVGPIAMWTVAGLDVRAHWPPAVPVGWSIAAFAVCAASSAFTVWAMASNRFFANTVRIQTERGHVAVDGGPYRLVRHPGYLAMAAFTLATPVALGSWRALIPGVLTVGALVVRTALEDRTLRAELEGYREYAARVPQKLVPGLW
jgi:protein-S-isoprenylcysteine O-methyltransferase Ste14